MRMLAPGNGIPQVNECVKGKESRSGQRGRARQAIDREPYDGQTGHEIERRRCRGRSAD